MNQPARHFFWLIGCLTMPPQNFIFIKPMPPNVEAESRLCFHISSLQIPQRKRALNHASLVKQTTATRQAFLSVDQVQQCLHKILFL
jgi:hypothetical protein